MAAAGVTALHMAVFQGRIDMLPKLIDSGELNLDAKDKYGQTAAHIAGYRGNAEALQLLLVAGADPNSVDDNGNSLLHAAAGSGSVQAAHLLLAAGLRVNLKNGDGDTPQTVAEKHCPEKMKAAMLDLLRSVGEQQAEEELAKAQVEAEAFTAAADLASEKRSAETAQKAPSATTASLLALLETKLLESERTAVSVRRLEQVVEGQARKIERLEVEVARLQAERRGTREFQEENS